MIYAGIDAGSRAIKVVLLDEGLGIIGFGIQDQGVKQTKLASDLLDFTLTKSGYHHKDIKFSIATGYGRDALDFADSTITEITCHAKGILHLHPEAQTIIDIGGQDSKLIRLDDTGSVRDFVMNDRCAAGTGRFLEIVSALLEIDLNELGKFAEKADNPSVISSMCVVFAETEIIGLLASGESPKNIAAGVQSSISSRIMSMAGRKVREPIIFTGGVALIPGMDAALEKAIGCPVKISKDPQYSGALGAAILASR